MSGRSVHTSEDGSLLRALLPEPVSAAAFDLTGEWAGRAPACGGTGLYLLARGGLSFAAGGAGVRLGAGDVVLMSRVVEHRIATRPEVPARPLEEVVRGGREVDGWWRVGDGRSGAQVHTLRFGDSALPGLPGLASPVVLPRAGQPESLRHIVDALTLELEPERGPGPASDALVRALWMKVLSERVDPGRLDVGMLRVVAAVREEIEAISSVERLARLAGLSRSRFTERFRAAYGEPPATWLTRERMKHAQALLLRDRLAVAEVADRLGYQSESAFRKAYKRILGTPARAQR